MTIIVRIIGGLGNQLFQYAAARRLAYMRKQPLKLDVSGYRRYYLRNYELNQFALSENLASPFEALFLKGVGQAIRKRFNPPVLQNFLRNKSTYYIENQITFNSEILELPGPAYLEGYFQSEKYFRDVEPVIRQDLQFKLPPDETNQYMANQITACEGAVSLHVRRGDYVTDPVNSKKYHQCEPDYYQLAVNKIGERVSRPHFFVFSDDPEWVENHIHLQFQTTYVTQNNSERSVEDLRLMSLCRHHIIANSTFSWWGAWLNPDPDKIVICPQKWYAASEFDDRDIIPDGWIKV